MLSTGTAWVIMSVVDADTTKAVPEWVIYIFMLFPISAWVGNWLVVSGATVDWWLSQAFGVGTNQKDLYKHLNEAVCSSPVGSRVCYSCR